MKKIIISYLLGVFSVVLVAYASGVTLLGNLGLTPGVDMAIWVESLTDQERDSIINGELDSTMEVSADDLNAKFSVLNYKINQLTVEEPSGGPDLASLADYQWNYNGVDLQTFITDYFPLNYEAGGSRTISTGVDVYPGAPFLQADMPIVSPLSADQHKFGYIYYNGSSTCYVVIYGMNLSVPTQVNNQFFTVTRISNGTGLGTKPECQAFAEALGTTDEASTNGTNTLFY